MNPSTIQLVISVGSILVLIGIAWGVLKQTQKQNEATQEKNEQEVEALRQQLNGVGTAMRRVDQVAEERYFATCIAMMLITPEKKQKELADIFMSGRHR